MFYVMELRDSVRVPPIYFDNPVDEAVLKSARNKFEGLVDADVGIVIDVVAVKNIGDGAIIAGDGAAYYDVTFELVTYKPELQEVVSGKIKDITDFGAFITMGPVDGMIHISQTMDDFVSFGKDKVLLGRDSKQSLKVGDECRAKVIAVSLKDPANPKIGLTMRQTGLGKLDWVNKPAVEKAEAPEKRKKE